MKYLLWGGAIIGAYLLLRKKPTAEQIVTETVGPSTTKPAETITQVNLKALNDWKLAVQSAFPNRTITGARINGELVCVDTPQGGVCATLMDALTLSLAELINLANHEGTRNV